MRLLLLVALALAVGCAKKPDSNPADTSAPNPEPAPNVPGQVHDEPLHSEKGIAGTIEIERRGHYNRLTIGGVMHGSQANEKYVRHWGDDFQHLVLGSPWDIVATVGAYNAFDPRQEPLSYYHRTGPVGAMFRELRTRKNGTDAKAPVGILGMNAGTEACYALPGQKFTFYETDPAIKRLVADTDKYFTYISDARKRGAEIDIRIGNRREKLKEDKDHKFALILVDQAELYPVAKEVFSKEAVQLYFDRLTDEGIVALQISNKYVNLEPMFARLAEELKLEARIWTDNAERGKPGKTASSWVVLAKHQKTLGTLALPLPKQSEYGTKFQPLATHRDVPAWTDSRAEVVPAMKLMKLP